MLDTKLACHASNTPQFATGGAQLPVNDQRGGLRGTAGLHGLEEDIPLRMVAGNGIDFDAVWHAAAVRVDAKEFTASDHQ